MPGDASILVITGPTASGKGALAFELARRLDGEIVSVDSMKVYRELDIVTAKPLPQWRSEVSYHLLDIVDPDQNFSVGQYLERLGPTLDDIVARGKRAILCGGTALYLKAYLEGLQSGPQVDSELHSLLFDEAATQGSEKLHRRLAKLDPGAAERIHPSDTRRLVRALEVIARTGEPLSTGWRWGEAKQEKPGVRLFGIAWEREELYARSARRVERMLERGLFEESRRLRVRVPPLSRSAAQTVGYKEITSGLERGLSQSEIVALIQQKTRRMAKHQMTWFRKFPVEWIAPGQPPDPAAQAQRVVERL